MNDFPIIKEGEYCISIICLVRSSSVQKILPKGLRVLEIFPRLTINAFSALKYTSCKDNKLEEEFTNFSDVWFGYPAVYKDKKIAYIPNIFNNNPDVIKWANENYGLNKKYAEIEWDIRKYHKKVIVKKDKKMVFQLSMRHLPLFYPNKKSYDESNLLPTTLQDGKLYATICRFDWDTTFGIPQIKIIEKEYKVNILKSKAYVDSRIYKDFKFFIKPYDKPIGELRV